MQAVRLSTAPAKAPVARASVVAHAAPVDRRAALGVLSGLLAATIAGRADAYVNAAQESMGGLGRATGGRGSLPKNTSYASMSNYSLESGIKKASAVSPKRRRELLAKTKAELVALGNKKAPAAPAPKDKKK